MSGSSRLCRPYYCATALLVIAACADPAAPRPVVGRPSAEIFDGANNAGNQHFYFLPPLVSAPATTGVADGTLAPEVSVCEWNGTACATEVAHFTVTAGTGSAVVGYNAGQQEYHVNWKTDQCSWGPCTLDGTRLYRLIVRVGSLELGHYDLRVFTNASQAKNAQTNEYIALVEGRTLPIRFRIEHGIVGGISISPNPATVGIGVTLQLTATVTDLHGAPVANAPVAWSVANNTIATIGGTGVLSGSAGGCTTAFATSGGVQASAPVTVTPVPIDVAFVRNNFVYGTGDGACGTVQLSESAVTPQPPEWSPDGTRLAALAHPANSLRTIELMRVDGGPSTYLTTSTDVNGEPLDWSPNGQRILFTGRVNGEFPRQGNNFEAFAVNVDGSGDQQITSGTSVPVDGPELAWRYISHPKWSPSGSEIVFDAYMWRGGGQWFDVVKANADGTAPIALTSGSFSSPTQGERPLWLPDGSTVVYWSWFLELHRVNADGSNRQTLVTGVDGDTRRKFSVSPNGQRVAFIRNVPGGQSLETVAIDGTGNTVLATGVMDDTPPSWSHDGTRIYFTRYLGNQPYVSRIDSNGTNDVLVGQGAKPAARP